MKFAGKIYVLIGFLSGLFPEGGAVVAPNQRPGIRPMVTVSPGNMRARANPKITAADVSFDLRSSPLNRSMVPTFERMANEMAILINNLYKRRELDEVNVRSLIRIRVYLAFIYRQTQQPKLKARIEEAVREINEELRHRLDFEERYKSGLIKRSASTSMSTMGTQTDNVDVIAPVRSVSSISTGPEGLSPLARANLRNAAARARAKVAERQAAAPQQSVTQRDPSQLSPRAKALLQLVESGKIDVSQLTQKDRALIAPYLKGGVVPSATPSQLPSPTVKKMTTVDSSVPVLSAVGAQRPAPDRSKLSQRADALLQLIESGKLKESQLSPNDRILINEYRSSAVPSSTAAPSRGNIAGAPPPPPPAPPMMGNQGAQTVASPPDSSALGPRAQALLRLVQSGKLQLSQLSPKDRNLLQQYVNQSVATDISQLPPPPAQ